MTIEPVPQDLIEPILFAFANMAGYAGAASIVEDYLKGLTVVSRIGRHGRWHFDNLMRTMGHEPPKAIGATEER